MATPSESMVSLQGRKIDALEQSVSVIVRMVSYPPDGGSLVMKLSAIVMFYPLFHFSELYPSFPLHFSTTFHFPP